MAKKANGAKLYLSIILIAVTVIFGTGGKLMYDVVRDLVVEQREVKKELMIISNYIAKTDVKTEYIEKQLEEIKEKLDR